MDIASTAAFLLVAPTGNSVCQNDLEAVSPWARPASIISVDSVLNAERDSLSSGREVKR
jgi:hypothetical protein